MPNRQRRSFPLLEVDPDLGRLLSPDRRRAAARELLVEIYRLPKGEWSLERSGAAAAAHVGLLLFEGVVSREVVVADCVSTELLGPGDILRPWGFDEEDRLLRHAVRWNALTECRVAILDRRFGTRLGDWPEINSVLIDRLSERARRLAATQAISQLTKVERRLTALFWHLAERWGELTPHGVVIPLTLSHRMLAQLIGARRPTVSTALARLADADQVHRRGNGTWVLMGEPAGLPAGEAARVIERRRGVPEHVAPAGTPEGAALASTSLEELAHTLEQLRTDAIESRQTLLEVSEQTRLLLQRTGELRAERHRQREARVVNGT